MKTMTINAYSPERLEQLAMRFFDLAAQLRAIARQSRQQNLQNIPVHDRKAIQWCENLEIWVKKTELNFQIVVQKLKAEEIGEN